MHLHHLKWALLLTPLLVATPAAAQYSPDASMDLGTGYGAIALGSGTLDGTRRIGTRGDGSDEITTTPRQGQDQPAPSPARVSELMAQLRPEYEARVRRDGKPRADLWLRETAFRLGEQEGRMARRNR
jgi:hypothetical protein